MLDRVLPEIPTNDEEEALRQLEAGIKAAQVDLKDIVRYTLTEWKESNPD